MIRNKKYLKLAAVLLFLVVIIAIMIWQNEKNSSGGVHNISTQPKTSKTNNPNSSNTSFDKKQHDLDDPTSVWLVVNKQRPLNPARYVPSDLTLPSVPLRVPGNESMQLRTVTARALEDLIKGAKGQNLDLMLSSGYRSYSYQVSLYNGYVASQSKAIADTQSARPGYSEHQTGLGLDIEPTNKTCEVNACFADTPEGKWVATNAYRYGFIIRYPKGKTSVTGYTFEPWHIRYVGKDLALEMHSKNIETLEEFFDLPAAPTY